jgi:hypothetical protein
MLKRRKPAEVDEVDDFLETLLRSGPFPGDDADEILCNAILADINAYKQGIGGDEIDAELLVPELKTAIINMVHGGKNPTSVPYRHIRHALDNPLHRRVRTHKGKFIVEAFHNEVTPDQRRVIDGPLKAIRMRCYACQGGSMDLVRTCPTVNCFSWPFRMASNPFYGRLVESTGEEDGFEGDELAEATEIEFEREQDERFTSMGAK